MKYLFFLTVLSCLLIACGGGSPSDSDTGPPPTGSLTDLEYTVGGTIFGLEGTVWVNSMEIEGGGENAIAFLLPNTLLSNDSYNIEVSVHPAEQTCIATENIGIVVNTNISDVVITCTDDSVIAATSPLNDTGLTWGGNYPAGNNLNCIGETIEQQDCSFGRDNRTGTNSNGHAGFNFTKLSVDGEELPADAEEWACVRDNTTSLVWEVKTDDDGMHDKDNIYRWGGVSAVANASGPQYNDWNVLIDGSNRTTLCGFTDWHVPRIKQLESLVDLGGDFSSGIDMDYFPNTQNSLYWSATPYLEDSSLSWGVFFGSGYTIPDFSRNKYFHLRLVSGGADIVETYRTDSCGDFPGETPNSQLQIKGINGDVIVRDVATGLTWMQCSEGQNRDSVCTGIADSYSWQEALQRPATINESGGYAGFLDWRLPNIKELRSIVEEACYEPAINSARFPNTPNYRFWSSTAFSFPQDWDWAWVVNFHSGYSFDSDRDKSLHVRLVRDTYPSGQFVLIELSSPAEL